MCPVFIPEVIGSGYGIWSSFKNYGRPQCRGLTSSEYGTKIQLSKAAGRKKVAVTRGTGHPREEGNAVTTATDAAPVALGKENRGRQDGVTGDESPRQGPYVQEQMDRTGT